LLIRLVVRLVVITEIIARRMHAFTSHVVAILDSVL